MSVRSDIKASYGWYQYETKDIVIPVYEADGVTPFDLSSTHLEWIVSREFNSRQVYLDTVAIGVSGSGNNIATITITAPTDYDNGLIAGNHYHELWDTDNHLLLSFGDAFLHPSRGPT